MLLNTVVAALLASAPNHAASVVIVHAKDYAYTTPKVVKASGPITIRLVNDGKELHHLSLVKIGKGHTVKEFIDGMKNPGPPPAWTTDVGGPNAALPGGTAEATLNLEPATYAMLCFINSPGDPTPHAMKGMVNTLVVEADGQAPVQAGSPMGDINIHLSDYKFGISKPFTAGSHVVTVTNDAVQSHEVVLVKLAPGKTVADLEKWIDKDVMKGPPPAVVQNGMAALSKGRSGTFAVNLTPGNYAMLCFVPDMKDGKAHAEHGMTTQFAVK